MQAVQGCARSNCALCKQCSSNSYYEPILYSKCRYFYYVRIYYNNLTFLLLLAFSLHKGCTFLPRSLHSERLTTGTVLPYFPHRCSSPFAPAPQQRKPQCLPLPQSPVRYESVRAFLGFRAGCGCDLVADGALPSR